MRPAIRLRVAHLRGGPTRDQKAVRTIYIYTDSEIIVLTRWGSLRLAPINTFPTDSPRCAVDNIVDSFHGCF